MIYGYIRVSTHTQNIARQYEELLKYGIKKENIFIDKESGKDFNRSNYIKLINTIRENDLVVIKSIDRLGRNYEMIIDEWKKITKDICANILVLDMPILDTRNSNNKLMGKFISDIVLQILSFVAENERNYIRERQREGIIIAKQNGVLFGRPKKQIDDKIIDDYLIGNITQKEVLKRLDISKSTLYRYINKK